jgi:hypothetical protein
LDPDQQHWSYSIFISTYWIGPFVWDRYRTCVYRARRSQLHSLQSRIRELTGQVEERDGRLATLATRLQEANNNKKELAKYKVPCTRCIQDQIEKSK